MPKHPRRPKSSPAKSLPSSTALIIVTSNQKDITEKTMRLIQKQTFVPHIIVVDNASTDDTSAYLKERFPDTTILTAKDNYGSSGGQYIGSKYAYDSGYEWIVLSDNDAFPVSPNLIEAVVAKATPDTVTQPWNDAIDTQENEGFWTLHYACYHRSIFARYGFPTFSFFIYGDDMEYADRLRRHVRFAKLKNVSYSHPMKKSYMPNRFYFALRNASVIDQHYAPLKAKIGNLVMRYTALFIYRYIGENEFYSWGIRGLVDYTLGRFPRTPITVKTSIRQKTLSVPPDKFKALFSRAYANVTSNDNAILRLKPNRFNCIKNWETDIRSLLRSPAAVQDSLVSYWTLPLLFFSPVIICLDSVEKDNVVYRRYDIQGYPLLKAAYLLLGYLIHSPLLVTSALRLFLPGTIKQPADIHEFLVGTPLVPVNAYTKRGN